ncbi:MAG: glycosyltransferase family 4 protein [Polaromonas sp.]|uniref:glycosyltransferase family 4 protein n=1 Tax=Polaromonas sp. TaxID=1869339 RepID=UPI00272F5057|nr:glycosyltransferase family 4 protein [Polaromonas sp.]MDP2451577.1 glycosyltransferase family 4 protein [Polaromonas sp.]MDP3246671.1 glycosyltransferase family 4 protein [Polaromonas sp.]MDP3755418.1 glycosyltransferase family 4 protein [Polaromonas sp.]
MSDSPVPLEAPRRLRIAVLNRVFDPAGGGAERYSIALVEQLAQRHEIHVFAQQIRHHAPGVTYHLVSMPLRKPRWLNQLWYATATWWATRRGFDVVHSHENTWQGQVQTVHVLPVKYNLFHGRTGWRRVLAWAKVWSSPRLLTYLGLERLRVAARGGRCVVVTSASLGDTLAATYPGTAAVTTVITPGVVLPAAPTGAQEQGAARVQLGLPPRGRCLLLVGNDYRKKGLGTLLRVLRDLPADVVLAVVGNPGQIPVFERQAQAEGVAGRVFFLGSLQDVAPAYRAADCLVHPTLEDTFAMVVLEAMAHGLPVVVSSAAYCGISSLLSHGAEALLLDDPQDAAKLAGTLKQVLGDEALRQQLGNQARAFASRYQWPAIARQQEAVYFATLAAEQR